MFECTTVIKHICMYTVYILCTYCRHGRFPSRASRWWVLQTPSIVITFYSCYSLLIWLCREALLVSPCMRPFKSPLLLQHSNINLPLVLYLANVNTHLFPNPPPSSEDDYEKVPGLAAIGRRLAARLPQARAGVVDATLPPLVLPTLPARSYFLFQQVHVLLHVSDNCMAGPGVTLRPTCYWKPKINVNYILCICFVLAA